MERFYAKAVFELILTMGDSLQERKLFLRRGTFSQKNNVPFEHPARGPEQHHEDWNQMSTAVAEKCRNCLHDRFSERIKAKSMLFMPPRYSHFERPASRRTHRDQHSLPLDLSFQIPGASRNVDYWDVFPPSTVTNFTHPLNPILTPFRQQGNSHRSKRNILSVTARICCRGQPEGRVCMWTQGFLIEPCGQCNIWRPSCAAARPGAVFC